MNETEREIWDGFNLSVSDEAGTGSDLSPHLIRVPESDWGLWRWSGLRSSGFPTTEVIKLSAPECACAADRAIQARSDFEESKRGIINSVHRQIKTATQSEKTEWEKALRLLKKGEIPVSLPATFPAPGKLRTAREQFDSAWGEYLLQCKVAAGNTSRAIRELAGNDLFKEAVIWQNRRAYHTGILPLLREKATGMRANSKTRQHEELVAIYLQRYCTKNDTIGFFGPVGWAQFDPAHFQISVSPGDGLISKRSLYFEVWCIDALGEILSNDERIRPWIMPRRMPFARLEGTLLYAQSGDAIRIDSQQAAIFGACNGSRTVKEIATLLKSKFSGGSDFEARVYSGLRSLQAMGVVAWFLEACLELYPERTLRALLERIEVPGVRDEALAMLGRLEASRDELAGAAGDPNKVDAALEKLEAEFTQLTTKPATRFSGETYAGRTLVFEDCKRDVEVTAGYDVIKKFGPPLSLLLDSARWFTFTLAERFRESFEHIFDELSQKSEGAGVVDYLTFWRSARPLLFDEEKSPTNEVLRVFQDKWGQVFGYTDGQSRFEYTSDAIRSQVADLFAAPGPGWSFARYHNADLLIAADGVEAIQKGDYKCILGELHIAANTLGVPLFIEQHDWPDELMLAAELDLPEPRLIPIVSKDWARISPRLIPALASPKDFYIELTTAQHRIPESKLLTSGSLVLDKVEGNLVVRTRNYSLQFDVIEAFASMIGSQASNKFSLFDSKTHTPRISIDDLVISRQTWRFRADELCFASQKDDAVRFFEARRLMKENRIPQFAFVKAPVEVKPFYVDFSSPIYVNVFSKVIRRCIASGKPSGLVTISEMLPGVDECWLPDGVGQLYASELRVIAVDQKTPAIPH